MSNLRQMQGGGGKNPEYVEIGSEGKDVGCTSVEVAKILKKEVQHQNLW